MFSHWHPILELSSSRASSRYISTQAEQLPSRNDATESVWSELNSDRHYAAGLTPTAGGSIETGESSNSWLSRRVYCSLIWDESFSPFCSWTTTTTTTSSEGQRGRRRRRVYVGSRCRCCLNSSINRAPRGSTLAL